MEVCEVYVKLYLDLSFFRTNKHEIPRCCSLIMCVPLRRYCGVRTPENADPQLLLLKDIQL